MQHNEADLVDKNKIICTPITGEKEKKLTIKQICLPN